MSADGKSLEIAIPRSLLTPAGGTAPTNINVAALDQHRHHFAAASSPATTPTRNTRSPTPRPCSETATHRVAIVYSDTSANLYFSQTAYSDLFMAAQNQARMAGVSYDVIDESQLTNINNLIGYDALIFPAMADVNTAQLPAIMSTLTSAVYNYHIGIITSGDFLTNDQTGAALPATPTPTWRPFWVSPGFGRQQRDRHGHRQRRQQPDHAAATPPARSSRPTPVKAIPPTQAARRHARRARQPERQPASEHFPVSSRPRPAAPTCTSPPQDLLGDSNLLSHAIQSVVLGTQPGVTLHTSRDAGIVAARMDMDQSQFPADVSAGRRRRHLR